MQPSKAKSSITETEEGILIVFNEEHPLKQNFLIDVTEFGIVISLNEMQS